MLIQIYNNGKDKDAQVLKFVYNRIEKKLYRNGIKLNEMVIAYISPIAQVMGYSFYDNGMHKLVVSNKIIHSKILEVVLTRELYRMYLIEQKKFKPHYFLVMSL